jgi:dihydrofolate synthase/folylpolyglutamate synthase
LPEEELSATGKKAGLGGNAYPNIRSALQEAVHNSKKKDLIVICGSVFVVGEVDLSEIEF